MNGNERLPARLVAAALARAVQSDGGFGTVLVRGPDHSESLLLLVRERGNAPVVVEKIRKSSDRLDWTIMRESSACAEDREHGDYLAKRRRIDPDLWIVELDVANAERFIASLAMLN